MKRAELAEVLGALTLGQGREFDKEDADFWLEMLKDLDGPAARQATLALLRETSAFITPAMIRDRVAQESLSRLRAVGDDHAVPAGLNQQEYVTFLKEWRRQIINGASVDEAERAAFSVVGRAEEQALPRGVAVTLPEVRKVAAEIETAKTRSDEVDSETAVE